MIWGSTPIPVPRTYRTLWECNLRTSGKWLPGFTDQTAEHRLAILLSRVLLDEATCQAGRLWEIGEIM